MAWVWMLCTAVMAMPLHAQETEDDRLAAYYYETGDYEKALLYYEKLYNRSPSVVNYTALFDCLLRTNDTKEAEKLVKKHMKRFNSNVLNIDLGVVYEAMGDMKSAERAYQEAIATMPKSQGMIIRTANEFLRRNKNDLALQTYQTGRKLLDNQYGFNYELAGLYGAMGDRERMVTEYLDLILKNEAYLQTVQNSLNRSLNLQGEEDAVLLRSELLRRIQKHPDNTVYAEMLTWLFLQQRDFNGAFMQLRGIDKRLNEQGQRILNLAALCVNNEAFDVASKCYNYIVEKGPLNPYYNFARAGAVTSEFEMLTRKWPPDVQALTALDGKLQNTIAALGANSETVHLYRTLSKLRSRYLGDLEGATDILNDALDIRPLPREIAAEVKLELAEILIMRGYIWDASLLSSQVEKDFKQDIQGFQAKLLNARISYYVGEFEWAQAQLDVLKGSTSKLISNDAMALSLLITDNLNLDTITDPMVRFARADLLLTQRRYDATMATLDSIMQLYPGHSLTDDILMRKARISDETGKLEQAVGYYKTLIANHYFDILADDALFELARLYDYKLNDKVQAQEYYKQLLTDFPGSLLVTDARKRFRELRGDDVGNPALQLAPGDRMP
jgi:tetratricopeptide (TPR) repeat protein